MQSKDIVLAAVNARYAHSSFGMRYLRANLGALRAESALLEFNLQTPVEEMAKHIAARNPRIVALGIYIWNLEQCGTLMVALKQRLPDTVIMAGGPELADPDNLPAAVDEAHYIVCGEGDLAVPDLCRTILGGERPPDRIIRADPPDLHAVALPYGEYTDEDVKQRVIYAEAGRGCPYACDYCLSANEKGLRYFPMEPLTEAWAHVIERGVRQFKFVDRSFNVVPRIYRPALDFFLNRAEDVRLHFEIYPDVLHDDFVERVARFPADSLHLEAGVQTLNDVVAARIHRPQSGQRVLDNLCRLNALDSVSLHADLIAGLPGETMESLADTFDRLVAVEPDELQFGMLKKLRGTPLGRHDEPWGMVYSPDAPYAIIENRMIDRETMAHLKHFARYWDRFYNRGYFKTSLPLLWADGRSPFAAFDEFSRHLWSTYGRDYGISLQEMAESLREAVDDESIVECILEDCGAKLTESLWLQGL